MAPFRRVVRVAKPIVKARKPQSCALFSSRNQPSAPGCPPFCSRLPAILLHVAALLLPLVRHSASGCPQFYLRDPGLCSHSTFYLPKGSLSPSRFCFSVPNVQYYVTKAHYYHIQANIPCNSRTKTSILCSGRWGLAPGRGEISIGKHNNGLPANHRAHFRNVNTL